MTNIDPQVPWSEEQWARVSDAVQKEAARSRVAASFLPLIGPLPRDADFVRGGEFQYKPPSATPETLPPETQTMSVDDKAVIPLATLQVKVHLRGAQVSDPQLTSALEMFRRAANVLARLEDAVAFRGQTAADAGPDPSAIKGLPAIWKVTGGSQNNGLFEACLGGAPGAPPIASGTALVQEISSKIGDLESSGHFGPFAVVLGKNLFALAQNPTPDLVLPSDRIIPFLGGGPLLRSSTLDDDKGIIVALGANPVELVIATDVTVGFLQVTTDPIYVFRVYERMALRIKEKDAIKCL
jgi:uncharacterized linocin/CFP29 family protein